MFLEGATLECDARRRARRARPPWRHWTAWIAALMFFLAPSGARASEGDTVFVDVLTYNVAFLPDAVVDTDQTLRAARMAPHLIGYDVVVLQELFVDRWRDTVLSGLEEAYPYRSALVGVDGAGGVPWRQDGGVMILSRWPIVREATLLFGDVCGGSDCLADKGVAYVAVRVEDLTVHVFGTHAQSLFGVGVEEVRAEQFTRLRAFVDAQAIPPDEPVLMVGDLNVDAATPELARMLDLLNATWPPVVRARRHTWDPTENAYATGPREWLDYVLVADDHLTPRAAWNRVMVLRDEGLDLSDHFAVWGRFVFPAR